MISRILHIKNLWDDTIFVWKPTEIRIDQQPDGSFIVPLEFQPPSIPSPTKPGPCMDFPMFITVIKGEVILPKGSKFQIDNKNSFVIQVLDEYTLLTVNPDQGLKIYAGDSAKIQKGSTIRVNYEALTCQNQHLRTELNKFQRETFVFEL